MINGNRLEKQKRHGTTAYTYDAFNRNTRVEAFDGNVQINRYDAEGLRYEMEENGRLVQFISRDTEVVMEETQEQLIAIVVVNTEKIR